MLSKYTLDNVEEFPTIIYQHIYHKPFSKEQRKYTYISEDF